MENTFEHNGKKLITINTQTLLCFQYINGVRLWCDGIDGAVTYCEKLRSKAQCECRSGFIFVDYNEYLKLKNNGKEEDTSVG